MEIKYEEQTFNSLEALVDWASENGESVDTDGITGETQEVVRAGRLNPENTQHTELVIMDIDDEEYEHAKIQLRLGDKYCDYDIRNSEASDLIEGLGDEEGYKEGTLSDMGIDIDEYNGYVDAYNKYGNAYKLEPSMTAEQAESILNQNDNLVN